MDSKERREWLHKTADWMADYYDSIESRPVKSQVSPGDIKKSLGVPFGDQPQSLDGVFDWVDQTILPGMTHWGHPRFYAYFPSNTSLPSTMGEMMTAAMGAQCMIWETSPAAAETEEVVLRELGNHLGIPPKWEGVIQDTASTATLSAFIVARERATDFQFNETGNSPKPLRYYASDQIHSSIEKGIKIAGIGRQNLVYVPTNDQLQLDPVAFEQCVKQDIKKGFAPCCVVVALGTTGVTVIDSLSEIARIANKYNIWVHVDAAYAGVLSLLPEYKYMMEGIEQADSYVVNAHKWLFTHFDCSLFYIKDANELIKTFEILPEYLKTSHRGEVNDYRDWGIPLGRRFRSLKLLLALRTFGMNQIRKRLAFHVDLGRELGKRVEAHSDLELLYPVNTNLVAFRYKKQNWSEEEANQRTLELIESINNEGFMYFTKTLVRGAACIRWVPANTEIEVEHIEESWAKLLSHLNH